MSFYVVVKLAIFVSKFLDMATSLLTTIPDLVFTSALTSLDFSTDLERVEVIVETQPSGTEIYKTSIYPFDGQTSILDFSEILDAFMLANGLSYYVFNIVFTDDAEATKSVEINALYCSYMMSLGAEDFCRTHFLTTIDSKQTDLSAAETLDVIVNAGTYEVKAQCVYEDAEGNDASAVLIYDTITVGDRTHHSITVDFMQLTNSLRGNGHDVSRLKAVTISCEDRYFSFYIRETNPDMVFRFSNCFNAFENVAFYGGVTATKTKVDRSQAICNSILSFYDQTVEKTFEVESAPLPTIEVDWIEQLFMSDNVRLRDGAYFRSVLITESTYELSDSNTDLSRVKFTWRYATKTPFCNSIAMIESRIHSDQFSLQYK